MLISGPTEVGGGGGEGLGCRNRLRKLGVPFWPTSPTPTPM
jgi:hypothetical protein